MGERNVSAPVLVTGGTGALGRQVVRKLLDDGREVRVLSRRARPAGTTGGPDGADGAGRAGGTDGAGRADASADRPEWARGDLLTGEGVAEAVAGVGAIVHCATASGRGKEQRAARSLIEAARSVANGEAEGSGGGAGPPHLVYVSIVGVDRVPFGYYRAKLAAERLIAESGLPYTILRATQFHDLVRALLAWAAKSPVMPVPALRFQPVDVREVAARLTELALGAPVLGRAPDFGGPAVRDCRELARVYLAATGRRRPTVPVALPGKVFAAYRRGGHLAPERAVGKTAFEQYLAGHPAPRGTSYRGG